MLRSGERERRQRKLTTEFCSKRFTNFQAKSNGMAQLSLRASEPNLGKTEVPVYNSGTTGLELIRRTLFSAPVAAEVYA